MFSRFLPAGDKYQIVDEAKKLFENNPYKLELISDYGKEGKELTRKEVGLYFKDYFFCGIMFKLLFDQEKLEDLLGNMSIRKLEFWMEEIK